MSGILPFTGRQIAGNNVEESKPLRSLSDFRPTLIRSKLLVPTPAGLLHRQRLCHALEKGLERKLTLVSAAAGYGKTSALVDFAQNTSARVCWYTADERDRDINLFVRYLVGAVAERFDGFGYQTRRALTAQGDHLFREPTAIVGDVVNEMLDLNQDFALVLDNFEVLAGALGVQEFTRRLVEVLPPNCHLMIGSRVLPDVPVTQLVARSQLVGLTEQDLRFEPEEIRELLRHWQVDISDGRARAIAARTEGWVTGVLLILDLLREDAALVLRQAEKATSHTYAYLASEVLDRQPPDVRWFLHTSSVLREMSAHLCRAVLSIDRPAVLLADVERRNLFLTRFGDGDAASYRYHNLFRSFLQERLYQREPARHADLHRRAGAWFQREHNVEEAVYHYLTAEAFTEATALMEQVAMEWFTRGRVETVLDWGRALPPEARGRAPWLSLYQSRALTDRYEYDAAREALAFAETGFAEQGDSARLARVYDQRAALALFEGRYEDTISQAARALDVLKPEEIRERAGARRLIGRAYVGQGRVTEGTCELETALELFREVDSPYDVLNVLQDLALAASSQGRYDQAVGCLTEALPLARRLGSPPQLANVLNSLGWIHDVLGELPEALKRYEEGLAAARHGGDLRSQANIAEGMATVYRNLGDCQRAEFFYDVAWRIASEGRPVLAVLILAARADMYRWQGDGERALRLVEQACALAEEKALDIQQSGLLRLSRGMALAEAGQLDRGLALLSDGVAFLEDQGARGELARGCFLKAKAHWLAGDVPRAVEALRRTLSLAQEIGTAQFAVVEGQYATELLELGVAQGLASCRRVMEQVEGLRALAAELVEGRLEERDATPKPLEIYALGEGRVVRDGRPVSSSEWRAAMAKELFFYILLHGPVERDAIGLVFWPDLPAAKVTSNFHSTLYRVRRAVGGDAVVVRDGKYGLGVGYWFDVEEFESLVERARLLPPSDYQAQELWHRALELYRDDFLPEVERGWCVPRRERLREQYIEALVEAARCHETRGAFEEAVVRYRRALEEDELREDVHRCIMRAYAELGRRSDALGQYDSCREILRRELGVEPSAKTRELYHQVSGVGRG